MKASPSSGTRMSMGSGASCKRNPAAAKVQCFLPLRRAGGSAIPFQRHSVSLQVARWASASLRSRKGKAQRERPWISSSLLFGTPNSRGYSRPHMAHSVRQDGGRRAEDGGKKTRRASVLSSSCVLILCPPSSVLRPSSCLLDLDPLVLPRRLGDGVE